MSETAHRIIDVLAKCRRVLITTHVSPDGDALGSAAAMVLAMKQKGIDAEVLLFSHLPRKYAFIFHDAHIPFHDVQAGIPADFPFASYDALVVVDTGTWSQLPGLQARIAAWPAPKIVIDHHRTQEDWADLKLVDSTAAAAGEIVYELLVTWGIRLDPTLAMVLFAAITTDTGWFQFSNTDPQTFRLAADLLEAGVDMDRMYQAIYLNERKERLALQTRAQQSLELHLGGQMAVMCLTKQDFAETGASLPDTENVINVPLQVATVQVSILIVEPPEGKPIRVSLRSKGQLDVAQFAEQFGGGGHLRAAGLKLDSSYSDAREKIIHAMVRQMANLMDGHNVESV